MLRLACCAAVTLLLAVACKRYGPLSNPKSRAPGGPQVQATVVTIRTIVQPDNRTTNSTLIIGDDFARAAEEIGNWRLFDYKRGRVAFVDDVTKSYRYESLKSLQQRHADAVEQPILDGIPRAEYVATGASRPILNVPASQSVVKLGGYQRELWIGAHPLIPDNLFALMQASELPGPAEPIVRKANEALFEARGFPLVEHTEIAFGKKKLVVDRAIVRIARQRVPESMLKIPESYREIPNAVREPAARRPAVASPPPDQKTPEAGSQSSATTQTNP